MSEFSIATAARAKVAATDCRSKCAYFKIYQDRTGHEPSFVGPDACLQIKRELGRDTAKLADVNFCGLAVAAVALAAQEEEL